MVMPFALESNTFKDMHFVVHVWEWQRRNTLQSTTLTSDKNGNKPFNIKFSLGVNGQGMLLELQLRSVLPSEEQLLQQLGQPWRLLRVSFKECQLLHQELECRLYQLHLHQTLPEVNSLLSAGPIRLEILLLSVLNPVPSVTKASHVPRTRSVVRVRDCLPVSISSQRDQS